MAFITKTKENSTMPRNTTDTTAAMNRTMDKAKELSNIGKEAENQYQVDKKNLRKQKLLDVIELLGGDEQVAKDYGVTASYVSQIRNGHRGFGEKAAENMEKTLRLEPGYFEITRFDIAKAMTSNAVNQIKADYKSDSIAIPQFDTKASMGDGAENPDNDLIISSLTVLKSSVEKQLKNVELKNLAFIHGIGDSMQPTFNDGDLLLIDKGHIIVDVDSIYVLEAHNRLFIKRVSRRLDGKFEITSDNPAVKTVDVLNGENEVAVRGRVIWVWNGKKL